MGVGLRRSFSRFEKLGSLDVKLQFVQSIRQLEPSGRVRNDSRALGPERSDDWEKRALEHMGGAIWSSLEQFGWDHLGSPGISEDMRIQGPGASLADPIACPLDNCGSGPDSGSCSGPGCPVLAPKPACSCLLFLTATTGQPPTPPCAASAAGEYCVCRPRKTALYLLLSLLGAVPCCSRTDALLGSLPVSQFAGLPVQSTRGIHFGHSPTRLPC